MNLNKAFVLGNLTRDPEKRSLPSGQPVVSFGLATNRFFTPQGKERQQETEFHNITIFGRLAEIASQYLKKGSLVLIEGRIKTRSWQDVSGTKRFKTEIIAENLQLGPRGIGINVQTAKFKREGTNIKNALADEEIPIIEEEPAEKLPVEKPEDKNDNDNNQEEIDVKKIPF